VPGDALIAALSEVQGTLAQLVVGQQELAEGQRILAKGLEEVRLVSSNAQKLSALWVDEANRERAIAETTRDRVDMLERRLTCPQENCPVMRYSNPGPAPITSPGTGPGE
jgi:phage terminase large subunit